MSSFGSFLASLRWVLVAFFAIYYFYKTVLNKTFVVDIDGRKIGKLSCDLTLAEMIGHILIWILLTIITLGIGLIFLRFSDLSNGA